MKSKPKLPSKYVTVSIKSYGNYLKGVRIYYEGKKPKSLAKDGRISFGKNILELLKKSFQKFQWIITVDKDSIEISYGTTRVRTSLKTLQKMYKQVNARTRDIKDDIIKANFSALFPEQFTYSGSVKYQPGRLAEILRENIVNSLSSEDKDALNRFLPDYISKESLSAVNLLKATTQIKTLKEISEELKTEIDATRSESWWQAYIQKNILYIQQGYIQAISKMNIAIGNTKFPDFSLVTHDGYLDILEIKRPSTPLIKEDPDRNNFYWETEMSKAIIQIENYLNNISRFQDAVRTYIKETFSIELKIVRPRGIILAGDSRSFSDQKRKDDFRLLSQSTKNIVFLTYDELFTRLENYIEVLEKHSAPHLVKPPRKRSKSKKE